MTCMMKVKYVQVTGQGPGPMPPTVLLPRSDRSDRFDRSVRSRRVAWAAPVARAVDLVTGTTRRNRSVARRRGALTDVPLHR